MTFQLRPYQEQAIAAGVNHFRHGKGNGVIVAPTGCHAKGTKVVMWDLTTKAVEDVCVGDVLMGPDDTPRTVLQLCRGNQVMYRIEPIKGPSFVVNEDHILSLECTSEGPRKQKRGGEKDHITVKEYLTKAKYWKHLRKLHRPSAVGNNVADVSLPIDPWMLGVILGDGCTMNGAISVCTPDLEIIEAVHDFAGKNECEVRTARKPDNLAVSLHIIKKEHRRHSGYENKVMGLLRGLGVAGKDAGAKRVPVQYLTGSVWCRREMLAGLLDTDGYHDGKGGYDFISKSEQLSNDVVFIARSLGITAQVAECRKGCQTGAVGTYFRVSLSGHTIQIPCRVERKKPVVRKQIKNSLRTGFSVHEVGTGDFYGFTLDGDHLYLTDDFIVHHNSGKSLIVAGIAMAIQEPVLVYQPSVEILNQNLSKLWSYGYDPGVFSASAGRKDMSLITLATIGSAVNRLGEFKRFKHVIVDECHLAHSGSTRKGDETVSMFKRFAQATGNPRMVGMSATPWRLATNSFGSENRFLTRMSGGLWSEVIHVTQIQELRRLGFLCDLEYYYHQGIDPTQLRLNSSGSDYTDASILAAMNGLEYEAKVLNMIERLLKYGRKSILVFTPFVKDAQHIASFLPGTAAWVSGETPKGERKDLLDRFKSGDIKVMLNAMVLGIGFDHPALDTVILGRPTASLSLYYQQVGRGLRPHPSKKSTIILDMVGNSHRFGKVEDFVVTKDWKGRWCVKSGGKQLTNVYQSRQDDSMSLRSISSSMA